MVNKNEKMLFTGNDHAVHLSIWSKENPEYFFFKGDSAYKLIYNNISTFCCYVSWHQWKKNLIHLEKTNNN